MQADHHHQVIQVHQPHPIPPLHPQPLKLKVHSESVKIPYHHPKIHHPHLIGYEHHVEHHEPQIKHVDHHQSW